VPNGYFLDLIDQRDLVNITDFEALSFDCYGTLIDWETGLAAVLSGWAETQGLGLDEERLLSAYSAHEAAAEAELPTELYPGILARGFQSLGEELGAPVSDEDAAALATSVPDWPAFEDSHDALTSLSTHFMLIILSNVDRASFAASEARLGVSFTSVLTAEDIGSYKPSPRNFDALAEEARRLGVGDGKLLHVAQSLFHDHVPAKRGRPVDRMDQPSPRPARLGGNTSTADLSHAGLGVPVDGRVRRRRGRQIARHSGNRRTNAYRQTQERRSDPC
jgi:2-haloacid dehalogenase